MTIWWGLPLESVTGQDLSPPRSAAGLKLHLVTRGIIFYSTPCAIMKRRESKEEP